MNPQHFVGEGHGNPLDLVVFGLWRIPGLQPPVLTRRLKLKELLLKQRVRVATTGSYTPIETGFHTVDVDVNSCNHRFLHAD